MTPNNPIQNRVDFTAYTKRFDDPSVNTVIQSIRDGTFEPPYQQPGTELIQLSDTDIESIRQTILIAKEKLNSLGLNHLLDRLPNMTEVRVSRYTDAQDEDVGGGASYLNEYIDINLPQGIGVDSPEFRATLYHEISHLVTKTIYRVGQGKRAFADSEVVTTGQNNTGIFVSTSQSGFHRINYHYNQVGLFEEGIAAIFSAYCSEDCIEDPYTVQTPFMFSLIMDFATKTNLSPLEVFVDVFSAKATPDFSIMKDLVDIYGTEFVRRINKTLSIMGTADYKHLLETASIGGFGKQYEDCKLTFDKGTALTFEGLTGSIKRSKYSNEYDSESQN